VTRLVDASGRPCPVPILELAKVARACPPGTLVALLATDPAVEGDVRTWCESTGNTLVSLQASAGVFRAEIRVGANRFRLPGMSR
jgi:tRNA 2-thiouridine synthesizing protein A